MPNPTIVPLIVSGIMIGIILRSTRAHVSWKFIIAGSLLGGLGNVANAILLYLFQGQQSRQAIPATITQVTPRAFTGQTLPTQSLASFAVLSFITGTLMILLVFIAARLTIRIRGRKIVEEEQQSSD